MALSLQCLARKRFRSLYQQSGGKQAHGEGFQFALHVLLVIGHAEKVRTCPESLQFQKRPCSFLLLRRKMASDGNSQYVSQLSPLFFHEHEEEVSRKYNYIRTPHSRFTCYTQDDVSNKQDTIAAYATNVASTTGRPFSTLGGDCSHLCHIMWNLQ